jgi:hypothetical protein
VVVPPGFVVVVAEGTVVLVGVVVVVVAVVGEDVVVVDGTGVVEAGVVVDVVVGVVVVVVVVEAGGGDWLMTLFTDVPVPPWPKIEDRGLPAMSSMAVTNSSASTNTMAAVPAMVFQLKRPREGRPRGSATPPVRGPSTVPFRVSSLTVRTGVVLACTRSVAGTSATAETSRRPVVSAAAAADSIRVVLAAA